MKIRCRLRKGANVLVLAAWAAAVLLAGAGTARAASNGNPVLNPMAREFTLSVEMGYFIRDMNARGRNEDLSAYGMSLKATFGITSRLAVFGRFGMSDLRLDRAGFSGSLEPSYGGGLMLALYRAERDPSLNLVLTGAYDRLESKESDTSLDADCFNGSLIMTKGVQDLLLYGGFRLSAVDLSGGGRVPDMDSDDGLGVIAGVDYGVSERIYLALELHLFDEYAVSGGIGFNFGR